MKKLQLIAMLLLVANGLAFAQHFEIERLEKLQLPATEQAYHATFSPTGDFLLFSAANYNGLKTIHLTNAAISTVTTDAGAGYQPQISADGKKLLFRSTKFTNNVRQNALIEQTIATGQRKQIVAPTREALPARFVENQAGFVNNRRLVRAQNSTATARLVSIENKKMVIYENSTRRELTPNGAAESYYWPVLSPDGKQIVYTVATKGTFVSDLNGRNVRSLGKLNAPKWLNNEWIVGMNDIDDGEKVISSDLLVVSTDGKKRQKLALGDLRVAMYPAASADGKRIAFNTDKGDLYIVNITNK